MFRDLYQKLRMNEGPYCVSIVLPTERGFQDSKMTHAVLSGAIRDAEKALYNKGLEKRSVTPYVDALERLVENFDFGSSQNGLGLYVGGQVAEMVHFPFPVERKVVVDQTFEVHDLVHGMGQVTAYYVLVLSQKDTKLYEGEGRTLKNLTEPVTDEELKDHPAADWSFRGHRDDQDYFHQYLNYIDKLLGYWLNRRKLPVILLGSEETVNYFINHSVNRDMLKGQLAGTYEHLPESKLLDALEPVLMNIGAEQARSMLAELDDSIGQKRAARGLEEVWKAAGEGRIQHLLVERGFTRKAWRSLDGYELFLEDGAGRVAMQDAVDDLIERALDQQGDVFFLAPGELKQHQQVAAALRY